MITVTEQKFWKSIRRSAAKLGWWTERVENTVSNGWPDVVVFTPDARTIMLELKIAKGPLGRIKVRPEQALFSERVSELPGKNVQFFFLALDDRRRGEFWVLTAHNVRLAMENGIAHQGVRAKKYSTRSLGLCLRRWNGEKLDIQLANSAPAEESSGLEFVPKKISVAPSAVRLMQGARV